jgi:hypothetical protein
MKAIREAVKFDSGLQAQSLNGNVTGHYFSLQEYGRVLACLIVGAMAATKTAKIELLQAKDADGTDAKGIPTTAEQAATATITANTKVKKATADITSIANTDVITVNGVAFTKAAAEDTDANEFDNGASLASQINTDVDGVTASFDTNTLTVVADDGYTVTIAKTENAGTITLATTEALAYVEITEGQLDLDNNFSHVAAKVTTDAAMVISAAVLRGHPRRTPAQNAAAKAVVEPGD